MMKLPMKQFEYSTPEPLHSAAASRLLEHNLANTLPPHSLMQSAGLALARLALALAPHAKTIWLACGPGNNGGDGIQAAVHLKQWGKQAVVSWLGHPDSAPADAVLSWKRAKEAGVVFSETPPPSFDLCIDALLGIGPVRPPTGQLAQYLALVNASTAPVLAVDLPSGLDPDTGDAPDWVIRAQHTLCLLSLKPGLFTAQGRDCTGALWFDPLGASTEARQASATAKLIGAPQIIRRNHDSHKGSYGDVAVIGGASGMTGAALLAATAALYAGAGRVFVGLLDADMVADPVQPELMFRSIDSLRLDAMTVVAGCGGATAIQSSLPQILSTAARLVLDADGLNMLAQDSQLQRQLRSRAKRQRPTVLSPHPLEAGRLLGLTTPQIQADRLAAAQELTDRFDCVVVLKGSGSVVASPNQLPAINPSGCALLATAGTGDVLAGLIGARLAAGQSAFQAACEAVYQHSLSADQWPQQQAFSASLLARSLRP